VGTNWVKVEASWVSGSAVESDVPIVGEQRHGEQAPNASSAELPEWSDDEREELLGYVRGLERELERYRVHAERTSKLFLSATNYAEWVRESARRDAEVALRKAGARVKELELTASELEQTKNDIVRQKDELARLQALTEATRSRLSAFLTAGLDALDTREDGADPAAGDLEGTLHRQLVSAPASSGPLAEHDTPES
jgi:hypothetical protein